MDAFWIQLLIPRGDDKMLQTRDSEKLKSLVTKSKFLKFPKKLKTKNQK